MLQNSIDCNYGGIAIMKTKKVTMPWIGLVAGTRGMLGAGAALLLVDKVSPSKRKKLGWALFLTGVLSTIPLGYKIFHS
jgi:hypothetical protein